MTIKATTKNFIQLVDIKDFRFEGDCSNIDYGNIAGDCDSKTISLLEAISHISLNIASLTFGGEDKKERIGKLSGVISDLAELAIATNKISQIAAFLSGAQGSNHG
ncbi:hypothetical protein MWI14_001373 [Salmonella enterica subsp. diarizonae]|nr:hypothetical protein [Salmonella enterica]EAS9237293.1 hypothetical protein [Salmonella enterica subsp. enterica]EHL1809934.1 hypothetical protein [Salmonella enterica subsp. diarizonae]EAA9300704.1 hypothetical protein [Salmonella enterica]EAA9595669.1 hypothetical protein [Salmonella enterica]